MTNTADLIKAYNKNNQARLAKFYRKLQIKAQR